MPRILVFRIGSIGDFLVTLPCLHLLRDKYPDDQICLLTNEPSSSIEVSANSIIQGAGLFDQIIEYPLGARSAHTLRKLRAEIKQFGPDLLVYLVPHRGFASNIRDYLFFRVGCRIRHTVGLPLNSNQLKPRPPPDGHMLWESEAERLGRQIASLGEIDFTQPKNWDLNLSTEELAEADCILRDSSLWDGRTNRRFIGLSIGSKVEHIKDWGNNNWQQVLKALGELKTGALVFFGGSQDRERSQELANAWPGPSLNLCGAIPPRISAAVLRQADLFLCHDSGPMHLAASVGTPCVAVFSRHSAPGRWFPFGRGHRVLYPLSDTGTIQSISPRQVIVSAVKTLDRVNATIAASGVSRKSQIVP